MPTRKYRPRLIGAWLIAAALLAGCGGGFKYNDAVGRKTPPGTEAPAGSPGVGTPGSPPLGSGTAPPTTSATPARAFCRDLTDLQSLVGTLLVPGGSPAAAAARARDLVQRLRTDAPAELRAAVTTLVQVQDRVIADLSATPPRVADLSAAIGTPAYRQALEQVVLYAGQHCSLSLTPPSP